MKLTHDDIRWRIGDDIPEENLEKDFFFSEEDITMAMRMASGAIAQMHPKVWSPDPANLPLHPGVIDLILYFLYEHIVNKIDREEIDIKGGGIDIDHLTLVRNNLLRASRILYEKGTSAVKETLLEMNISRGWGCY